MCYYRGRENHSSGHRRASHYSPRQGFKKKAMPLQTGIKELNVLLCDVGVTEKHRAIDSRSLIVSHALNSLIKRRYRSVARPRPPFDTR